MKFNLNNTRKISEPIIEKTVIEKKLPPSKDFVLHIENVEVGARIKVFSKLSMRYVYESYCKKEKYLNDMIVNCLGCYKKVHTLIVDHRVNKTELNI